MKKLSAKQEKSDTWVVSSSIKNLLRVYNWKGQPMRIGSTMDDCDPRLKLVVFDVYCININQLYTLTLQVPISSSTFWYVYTQKKRSFRYHVVSKLNLPLCSPISWILCENVQPISASKDVHLWSVYSVHFTIQWIGLRDSLQESPNYYMGKSMVSG